TLMSFDAVTGVLTGKKAGKTQLVVKGPGPGLAYTWAIRVIAAALKLSATRVGLPLNRRYGLHASFADETGAVIGPATAVTFVSDNPPAMATRASPRPPRGASTPPSMSSCRARSWS